MRIWITVPEGARAPLDNVEASDTIDNVKQLITIQFWLSGLTPGSPFSLHYKCQELRGESTLEDHNIVDGTSIVIQAESEYTCVD